MSRPYADTFEKDLSSLSPVSSSSQTPISYSANVSRQKTKKWVDAKPADYGGDDWGDEYDGDYSSPPVSKPTGLRQPGQAVQPQGSGGSSNSDGNKKSYGDLPPLPTEPQPRSVTNPAKDRANSLTQYDERRAFSGGHPQPSAAAASSPAETVTQTVTVAGRSVSPQRNVLPALQVSTQLPGPTGLRRVVQSGSAVEVQAPQGAGRVTHIDEPESGTSSKYSEATSKYSDIRTPSSDFQTRRDFSPSAVPPPLQTRYSPAPQSAVTESPASRFPPRKSSISQQVSPGAFEISQSAQEVIGPKPWAEARSSSPGATARSPTTSAKTVPFIRPADIYKRLEEEREKERQSMDSGRPSMESILGGKASDRSSSPAKPTVRGQSSSDSLGGSFRKGAIQESEDKSDSGRRAAPILEPVRERKSEYGFEGFDPTLAARASKETAESAIPADPQEEKFDPQDDRRFSASPKLPDLNRMSGFGLDLFSQSKSDQLHLSDSTALPVLESQQSINEKDSNLRTQPSLGFTSVVHQAFDTTLSSIPETPASLTGSGVGGTVSESISTTSISPIMSRVPSGAVANAKGRELESRESATPSITEVDESDPPQGPAQIVEDISNHSATPQPEDTGTEGFRQPPFRPGHRPNISIPSPSNISARIPNVATTGNFAMAEEARVSEASDPMVSPVDEEPSPPQRPFAEGEHSFRPALPGGWGSYATTAGGSTTEQEPRDNQLSGSSLVRSATPDIPVSPISETEETDNDVDLTPTTAKRPLPQSALGAAAGAALGSVAAATFGRRDKSTPSTPTPTTAPGQPSRGVPNNSALRTPDPALAPMGNPYTASDLDPRLQAETQYSKSALQAPRPSFHQAVSSTKRLTPLPKDTPAENTTGGTSDYIPPPIPLKQKTLDEVAAEESSAPPTLPQILPTLSTQTSPQDDENDKLRKEIIKSLSPRVSDAEAGQRLSQDVSEKDRMGDSAVLGIRESTYLPSEYDNYWESTNETESGQDNAERPNPSKLGADQHPFIDANLPMDPDSTVVVHPIPPLSPQKVEKTVDEADTQSRQRALLANRFSWEVGPEQVSSKPAATHTELQAPMSKSAVSYTATPDTQLQQSEKMREAYFKPGPINTSAPAPAPEDALAGASRTDSTMLSPNTGKDHPEVTDHGSSNSHAGSATAATAAGIAARAASAEHQMGQNDVPRGRPSPAEEKITSNVSTDAVSPTSPEDEDPANTVQPLVSSMGMGSGPPSSRLTEAHESINTPRAPQEVSDLTKIMQFRDILALQNQDQRIRAYNDTRHQFAIMDTGLREWLMSLSNQHEHIGAGSQGIPSAIAGINAAGLRGPKSGSPGIQGLPLQQPYYQHYLNASPTTSIPPMSRPGTGVPSGSQQGFSPSGGKLSGQQAQVKSKGVFGGKAGKAGKGLLAKSKNRFRGSGGGDKTSPPLEASPAPKPKVTEGRRSSWGALALSRSSGRTDSSSQHSRESTPTHQPPPRLGPEYLPHVTVSQTELSIWDAPVSAASTPSIQRASLQTSSPAEPSASSYPASNGKISKEEEEHDKLGVPALVGKNQPSWDPFNATPIIEEEGFQYDERPLTQPPNTAKTTIHSMVLPLPVDSRSKRSSGDGAFFDAPEQPAEAEDWVLISKEESLPQQYAPPTRDIERDTAPRAGGYPQPNASTSQVSTQPPPASQGGFPGRLIQHIRQRSSKETNVAPTGQSLAPQFTKTENQHHVDQNDELVTRPREFVGLPPIRRSSTFGLGFRTDEPNKKFPLDGEENDAQWEPTVHPTSQVDTTSQRHAEEFTVAPNSEVKAISQRPAGQPMTAPISQVEAGGRSNERPAAKEAASRATAIAATVGDRMNQPSVEPSRYSFQKDPRETVARAHEIQNRPTATARSSDYSQYLSLSPVSPLVPPPVLPTVTQSNPPIAPRGPQGDVQQPNVGADRRQEALWQPNVRMSQEQRSVPPPSYQHPPSFEAQHSSQGITHRQHPSFEGQRTAPLTSQPGRPPFEGQQIRSSPSSGQGYMGLLPPLNTGRSVPPPRAGPNQQKPFDEPPSSAQRYPELFRSEQILDKETSVDGLPAHYYQAPVSREDAFLPRQQTNEYQLPGVGPPPDEQNPGKRSRRDSALFEEVGGRLSRTASRDRGLTIDDDAHSALDSRNSHGKEFSEPSITSEDTIEKKKRKSGLALFGAPRRDSAGGPPQSRENIVTHMPGTRTDLLASQLQQPGSSLATGDRKRSFFSNSRSSSDQAKEKPNKMSRASTGSPVAEQTGKKKRFSGLTTIFSRSNVEQGRKDPVEKTVQSAQDPRNYQRPNPLVTLGPQLSSPPPQLATHDPRNLPGQRYGVAQGEPFPQQTVRNMQDPRIYQQLPPGFGQGGQINQPQAQTARNPQDYQRQESAVPSGPPTSQQLPQAGPQAGPQGYQRQESAVPFGPPMSQPLLQAGPQNRQYQESALPSGPLMSQPLLQAGPQSRQWQESVVPSGHPISQPLPQAGAQSSPQGYQQQKSAVPSGPPIFHLFPQAGPRAGPQDYQRQKLAIPSGPPMFQLPPQTGLQNHQRQESAAPSGPPTSHPLPQAGPQAGPQGYHRQGSAVPSGPPISQPLSPQAGHQASPQASPQDSQRQKSAVPSSPPISQPLSPQAGRQAGPQDSQRQNPVVPFGPPISQPLSPQASPQASLQDPQRQKSAVPSSPPISQPPSPQAGRQAGPPAGPQDSQRQISAVPSGPPTSQPLPQAGSQAGPPAGPQGYQRQGSAVPSGPPISQPLSPQAGRQAGPPAGPQDSQRQMSAVPSGPPTSQPLPQGGPQAGPPAGPQDSQRQKSANSSGPPMSQPLPQAGPQNHQRQALAPFHGQYPTQQPGQAAKNPQNYLPQMPAAHPGPSPQLHMGQHPVQTAQNREFYPHGPAAAQGGQLYLPPLQGSQPQYQQHQPSEPKGVAIHTAASPQARPRTSQERQRVMLTKQPPVQLHQPQPENKQRRASTSRLLGGLIGGRRSSGQQEKDIMDTRTESAPQRVSVQKQQHVQQEPQSPPLLVQQSGQSQERGRSFSKEPQYEPLPIPGGYSLVRGEGNHPAPTSYDPRGLNVHNQLPNNRMPMHPGQIQAYPPQAPHFQVQQYGQDDSASSVQHPNQPQPLGMAPQNLGRDIRPGLTPQPNPQTPRKAGRPLSSEDLVARSPARPQFGQQAPYQLSLPDELLEDDTPQDRPVPADRNFPTEQKVPPGGKSAIDKGLPTERNLPTQRALPATHRLNTDQQLIHPALRHPLSPATYPLPEDTMFSPINPSADQLPPPPPPPEWPNQADMSQNLDRSKSTHTNVSEISQLSGQVSLNIPRIAVQKEERPSSATPPSPQITPQITPERSPERVTRDLAAPQKEEDAYSISPSNSTSNLREEATAKDNPPSQSPEKILVDGPQDGRRRASQEEKILVEEGMLRPGSAEDEVPSMSATSYPGQEWHPYGNGYEEWD